MIMGVGYSLVRETFPPKSRFSVDDIPDLTGKVAIVTGSNTGKYSRNCILMLASTL